MSVTSVVAGEAAQINYSNPALAGQQVTIDIDNGNLDNTIKTQITIELDAQGNGVGEWLVPDSPDWMVANINGPSVPESSHFVGSGTGGG